MSLREDFAAIGPLYENKHIQRLCVRTALPNATNTTHQNTPSPTARRAANARTRNGQVAAAQDKCAGTAPAHAPKRTSNAS